MKVRQQESRRGSPFLAVMMATPDATGDAGEVTMTAPASDDGLLPAWHQAIIWGPIISIFIHVIYMSYSYDICNIILICILDSVS